MNSEIIEVIGRFVEEEPGIYRWEGPEPDPAMVRLWRPSGRYYLLDGTIADAPQITVRASTPDDEIIGASALGSVLSYEGFMAAWQGLTTPQRRNVTRTAGEAARGALLALTRRRGSGPRPNGSRTPDERGV